MYGVSRKLRAWWNAGHTDHHFGSLLEANETVWSILGRIVKIFEDGCCEEKVVVVVKQRLLECR